MTRTVPPSPDLDPHTPVRAVSGAPGRPACGLLPSAGRPFSNQSPRIARLIGALRRLAPEFIISADSAALAELAALLDDARQVVNAERCARRTRVPAARLVRP